jgi:hypothetical protein
LKITQKGLVEWLKVYALSSSSSTVKTKKKKVQNGWWSGSSCRAPLSTHEAQFKLQYCQIKKKPKADIRKSVILGYNHSTWHIA